MIVLDASAVAEYVLNTERGRVVGARLADPSESFSAPHLIDAEVAHALRRCERVGEVSKARARAALRDLMALPVRRYRHDVLLPRVWELRENATAYDAMYLVLAEALDAVLITCDRRMRRVAGSNARVEVIEPPSTGHNDQT